MTAALAVLKKHRNVLLIDMILLAALYLLPGISHAIALPLYMLEPMRVALIISLLLTNRTNTYFIAFTIPLASYLISGHPVLFKAILMGIEFSILVATFAYLQHQNRMPTFLALMVAIIVGKMAYYLMKYVALSSGLLAGNLISTPVLYQLLLAVGTAAVFGLVEYYRGGSGQHR